MIRAKGTPYRYQQEVIDFHKSKSRSLSLLDMGLGKSLVALHSMEGFNRILIICPAFLISNWGNEVSTWVQGGEFKIVSYDSLKKIKEGEKFDGIILDEIHYIKNKDAMRTKVVFDLVGRIRPKKLIGLTGTPIKNKVLDFWTLLYLVLEDKFKYDYWQYANRFSNKVVKTFGRKSVTSFEGLNSRNVAELSAIVKSCAIRKKTSDVLDLPEQNFKYLRLGNKDFDESLESEFKLYLETNNITKNIMSYKLSNAKVKTQLTINLVKEFLAQDCSVVVFTDHKDACYVIAQEFGVTSITGDTQDRQNIVNRFNKGDDKVIVATIKSLNVGVNLTTASHMIFNDFSYTYSDNEQAEKRIHRIGQKNKCFYYYVFASDLDETIYKIQKDKKITASKVVE